MGGKTSKDALAWRKLDFNNNYKPNNSNTLVRGIGVDVFDFVCGDAPSVLEKHSCIQANGGRRMIVFGGISLATSACCNATYELDLLTFRWKNLICCGQVPNRCHSHSACNILDKSMLVFGGVDSHCKCHNLLYELDLTCIEDAYEWKLVECVGDVPVARYGHSAVVAQATKMIVFGGSSSSKKPNPLNDMWQFDYVSKTWTEIYYNEGLRPPPRLYHTANIVLDTQSYTECMAVFGGTTHNNDLLNDMYIFNFERSFFQQVVFNDTSKVPEKRKGHSAICYDNKLIVFGGFSTLSSPDQIMGDLNIFCFDTLQWSFIELSHETVVTRSYHSTVLFGDFLILFGGISGQKQTGVSIGELYSCCLDKLPRDWEIHYEDLKILAKVGEGQSGIVFSAYWERGSGQASAENIKNSRKKSSSKKPPKLPPTHADSPSQPIFTPTTSSGSLKQQPNQQQPQQHQQHQLQNQHQEKIKAHKSSSSSLSNSPMYMGSSPLLGSSPKLSSSLSGTLVSPDTISLPLNSLGNRSDVGEHGGQSFSFGESFKMSPRISPRISPRVYHTLDMPISVANADVSSSNGNTCFDPSTPRTPNTTSPHTPHTPRDELCGESHSKKVAVKKFKLHGLKANREVWNEFLVEVNIARRIRHPNVLHFIGACFTEPNICIITELCRGNLSTTLLDPCIELDWEKKLTIALDIACAMSYLHSHTPPILHRDLKSMNILITDDFSAKICDFGMAKIKNTTKTASGIQGSPLWMSPQVLRGEAAGLACDVYSFGIVMWEILTRKLPFQGENAFVVTSQVMNGRRPDIPTILDDHELNYVLLMHECWHQDADARPDFPSIVTRLEVMRQKYYKSVLASMRQKFIRQSIAITAQ